MPKDRVKPLDITSRNSNTLTAGTLRVINEDGLSGPCFMIRITNASNQSIVISYDGVTDHDVLLDDSVLEVNFQNNSRPGNQVALLPTGTKVWVKGTAGTGFIYLSGFYQES